MKQPLTNIILALVIFNPMTLLWAQTPPGEPTFCYPGGFIEPPTGEDCHGITMNLPPGGLPDVSYFISPTPSAAIFELQIQWNNLNIPANDRIKLFELSKLTQVSLYPNSDASVLSFYLARNSTIEQFYEIYLEDSQQNRVADSYINPNDWPSVFGDNGHVNIIVEWHANDASQLPRSTQGIIAYKMYTTLNNTLHELKFVESDDIWATEVHTAFIGALEGPLSITTTGQVTVKLVNTPGTAD